MKKQRTFEIKPEFEIAQNSSFKMVTLKYHMPFKVAP